MKPREVIISQINHQTTDPVPYVFSCEPSVADRMDAHYGSSQWRERLLPFMKTCLSVDTLQERPVSSSRVQDGYGGIWRVDRRPWHLETPPLAKASLAGYRFPSAGQFVDPVREAVPEALQRIKESPDSFQIIAMGWGLFEQTWRLRGFENALMDAIAEPDFYAELLERLTELYLVMIRACRDVPADAFFFGDDWGEQNGVILGPDRWRQYIKPRWAEIYKEVHAQGKYVISHCCGSIAAIMPDVIEMGLDVLESVQPEAAGMSPYLLNDQWGSEITWFGCLGSQSLLPFGTPDEIKTEVTQLRQRVGAGGGLIMAAAKPLQPETPTENAVALYEAFVRG